jgi:hypothetical protein
MPNRQAEIPTSAQKATETSAWRNRITGSGSEPPEALTANPANWRVHPKHQRSALTGALDRVGWVQQVLVRSLMSSRYHAEKLALTLIGQPRYEC